MIMKYGEHVVELIRCQGGGGIDFEKLEAAESVSVFPGIGKDGLRNSKIRGSAVKCLVSKRTTRRAGCRRIFFLTLPISTGWWKPWADFLLPNKDLRRRICQPSRCAGKLYQNM